MTKPQTNETRPVLDANGNPVDVSTIVPPDVAPDPALRAFFAGRVPAKGCPHYISASEAYVGFTTCEHCYRKD